MEVHGGSKDTLPTVNQNQATSKPLPYKDTVSNDLRKEVLFDKKMENWADYVARKEEMDEPMSESQTQNHNLDLKSNPFEGVKGVHTGQARSSRSTTAKAANLSKFISHLSDLILIYQSSLEGKKNRETVEGYFILDVLVAATIGVITGLCVGPLVPIVGNWLARSSIMQFLLHIIIVVLALSSQFFPYSNNAPKRVVFQHMVLTAGIEEITIQVSSVHSC
ncbi:hypothetical protein LguiA_017535 [Lonicera macranthoides]